MTRIDIEFAIIGIINQKLEQRTNSGQPIVITETEIQTYGHSLEVATGLAILNNFYPDDIKAFLETGRYQGLFKKTYNGQTCYEFMPEKLRHMSSYPNITAALMERMDPRLNYPMPVIEASGLLKILESEN